MLFDKAFKIRDIDTGKERKTPDGQDMMAMAHSSEIVKGPSDLDRSFWMVASDQTRDRDGDVIRAKGWNLKNFKKNPIGLWGHQYHELPVFRVPDIKVEDNKLKALMHFPEELGGISDDIFRAYQAKVLNASSVGFGVEEIEDDPKKREEVGLPEQSDWGNGFYFFKTELWELSAVTVPSNPEALAQIKEAGVKTPHLEEMLQRADDFVIELTSDEDDDGKEPDKTPKPESILSDDIETMKLTLEEAGYVVSPDDETINITAEPEPEPVTLTLDLSPKPAEMTAEQTDQVARSISEAQLEQFKREVADAAKTAFDRVINFHNGKIED